MILQVARAQEFGALRERTKHIRQTSYDGITCVCCTVSWLIKLQAIAETSFEEEGDRISQRKAVLKLSSLLWSNLVSREALALRAVCAARHGTVVFDAFGRAGMALKNHTSFPNHAITSIKPIPEPRLVNLEPPRKGPCTQIVYTLGPMYLL